MTGSRRAGGPRLGPRVAQPQGAPPPLAPYLGGDRAAAGMREVDIAQIAPDPDQPRRLFDPVRLAQLAASIREHGLLQPLVVREAGLGAEGDMRYIVIAGGRRLAAIRWLAENTALDDAERDRVRRVAVVLHRGEAAERRVLQLVENIQREALTPVEEARAFREIMRVDGSSTAALAERIGRSQGYVDERLRLLRHEAVEAAVEGGVLTASAGAAVASLPAASDRAAWLARAGGGERVAAAAVYASKPRSRARSRAPVAPALPPVAAPPAGETTTDTTGNGSATPRPRVASSAAPTAPAPSTPPALAAATTGNGDAVIAALHALRADLSRLAPPTDEGWRREYTTALSALIEAAGEVLRRLSP